MNPISSVCFVIPPSPFLLDERVFMSLGILKVAAVCEQSDISVDVLDLSGISNPEEALISYVQSSNTQTFGFTATTPQMPSAARLAHVLRTISSQSKLIIGGPHPTLAHAAVKKEILRATSGRAHRAMADLNALFDTIVCGDGERALFDALEKFGVIDADDPKSALFLTNKTLNEMPFPARHLIDMESYHYTIDGEPATSLVAQLGCPFGCRFCGGRNSPMLRRIRMRTTENIISEMRHLYETYGFKGFMFYDDELNVNPRMIELMNAISGLQEELNVHFKLRGFIKAQLFSDEQAKAMYQAGFRWILTGFESGSPRILENINKHSTREENTRCVQIAHTHGLKVKALMSIGHPGESLETIQETKDWLLMNLTKTDDFDVTIITPYPGSPYYDDAVEEKGRWVYRTPETGDILYAKEVDYFKEADFYKGAPGDYKSYVWTETLSCAELVQARDRLERDVRGTLHLPFYQQASAQRFEHSMGQGLPETILKKTKDLTNFSNESIEASNLCR